MKDDCVNPSGAEILPPRLFETDCYPPDGRINCYSKPEYLLDIVEALEGTREFDLLLSSSLGSLFRLPVRRCSLSGKLVHNILCRSLHTLRQHEIWFVFGGHPFRFSLREFALLTGLPCGPYPDVEAIKNSQKPAPGKKSHWEKIIGNKTVVSIQEIVNWLKRDKRMPEDKKMPGWKKLQLALIVIVEGILIVTTQPVRASMEVVEMVKNVDNFLAYPWGRESFELTLRMVKVGSRVESVEVLVDKLLQSHTATHGFTLAIQLFILQSIPLLQLYLPDTDVEQDFTDRSIVQLTKLKTYHNPNILAAEHHSSLQVIPILNPDHPLDDPDTSWPGEVQDQSVDYLLRLISDGHKFTKDVWHGGHGGLPLMTPSPQVKKRLTAKLRSSSLQNRIVRGKTKVGPSIRPKIDVPHESENVFDREDLMMQLERMMDERISRMKADVVNDVLAHLTLHGLTSRPCFTGTDGAGSSKFGPHDNPSDPVPYFKDMSRWDDYFGLVNILTNLNKEDSVPDGKVDETVSDGPDVPIGGQDQIEGQNIGVPNNNLQDEEAEDEDEADEDFDGSNSEDTNEVDGQDDDKQDETARQGDYEDGGQVGDVQDVHDNGSKRLHKNDADGQDDDRQDDTAREVEEYEDGGQVADGQDELYNGRLVGGTQEEEDEGRQVDSRQDQDGREEEVNSDDGQEDDGQAEDEEGGKVLVDNGQEYSGRKEEGSGHEDGTSDRSEADETGASSDDDIVDDVDQSSDIHVPDQRPTHQGAKRGEKRLQNDHGALAGQSNIQPPSKRPRILPKRYRHNSGSKKSEKNLVDHVYSSLGFLEASLKKRFLSKLATYRKKEYYIDGHPVKKSFFTDIHTPKKWLDTPHMEALLSLVWRKLGDEFLTDRIAVLDTWFTRNLANVYAAFKKNTQSSFSWNSMLKSYVRGIVPSRSSRMAWFTDVDTIYAPMHCGKGHWVSLVIRLRLSKIIVLDPLITANDERKMNKWMKPVLELIPAMVRQLLNCDGLDFPMQQSFSYERVRNIYQNERTGDCGPVAVKFIELHAQSLVLDNLTDPIVDQLRMKYAFDVYEEFIESVRG